MRFIGFTYTLLFLLITAAHSNGWASGLKAMVALHFSLVGIMVIKTMVELNSATDNRKAALGSFSLSILACGIAFKLVWMPYADWIIGLGAALILATIIYHRKSIQVPVFVKRNLLVSAAPLTIAAGMFFIADYHDLFHYANKSRIAWSPSDRIEWSSFNGKSESNSTFDATIYSVIQYDYRWEFDAFHYTVEAYFDPNRSWHCDGTEFLLEHERIHFDLTAVYAAMLRQYFEDVSAQGITDPVQVEQDAAHIIQQWDEAQKLYDLRTQHGTNFKAQLQWQSRVDSLLVKYYRLPEAPVRHTEKDTFLRFSD